MNILTVLKEAKAVSDKMTQAEQYLQNLSLTEEFLRTMMKSVSEWSNPIEIEINLKDGRTVTIRQVPSDEQIHTESFRERFERARK